MSSNISWIRIDGVELIDARDEERLNDLIPASSGLYVWRRRLVAPNSCKISGQEFRNWILKLSEQANAKLPRRSLSHCVWSEGIEIGGGGLTEDKVHTLNEISSNSQLRKFAINYIESLSDFFPAIYIGEANNFRKRAKQHLDGETGLLEYTDKLLNLQWEDLQFQYYVTGKKKEVSSQKKSMQELLEMIAQRTLAPFATKRPG